MKCKLRHSRTSNKEFGYKMGKNRLKKMRDPDKMVDCMMAHWFLRSPRNSSARSDWHGLIDMEGILPSSIAWDVFIFLESSEPILTNCFPVIIVAGHCQWRGLDMMAQEAPRSPLFLWQCKDFMLATLDISSKRFTSHLPPNQELTDRTGDDNCNSPSVSTHA